MFSVAASSVVITEVDPAGSNSSYAADWFEVTNTGASDVNISGWKMDDNSNGSPASAEVAIHGLLNLPAGRSAIFLEDTSVNGTTITDTTIINAFSSAWFGSATPPAGLLYGFYGGPGVGLSTSTDAVNLFDSTGALQANVSFGATTTGKTFDNTAGLNNTTISQLSVVGLNGAAVSANSAEVGSPGYTASGLDLSRYVRVGRYDLPEPTRTTPPDGTSLLAQEASAVTYDWDTDTLFVAGDGGTSIVQVSKTGQLINSMTLAPGGSPQGTEFYDTEGLTYVGSGKFVMTEERYRQVDLFTYAAGTTLHRADTQTVKLGTTIGNIGLEGVSYDPLTTSTTGGYVLVKEKDPEGIFQTNIDFAAGTATNGSPTTDESTNLFDPSLAGLADFSDVFALSNLPFLNGKADSSHLLVISQESGQIINVDRSGNVSSKLTIVADPGNPLSVADQTHEGVTMDRNGILYTVSENGGGDSNHPQLWVYAPSAAFDQAPTAVALNNAVTSLPQNTSTAAPVKLGDIVVTDDGLGANNLSVSGPDASLFHITGTALYLNAGTTLSATTYNITVNVDDPSVGTSPDATTSYALTITPPEAAHVVVSEVAPWSSGNSSLGADWFEVTNIGTTTADITGWSMDDNSNSSALSVPLEGVGSIAPGESVIFVESATDISAAFKSLWFGANPPAGLQVGHYSGSGVGLSTGGDAVNLFAADGTLQAHVDFGTSPQGPFPTFDNSAGLNDATIATLSVVGTNGAFAAANDANEIGSPGTVGTSSTPIVTIAATDANAAEAGNDPGTFRISRSGSTVGVLSVSYTIATGPGQATSDDYTPALTGAVTIPAGASFVDVTITPVDDALVEGTETLTLTLSDTGSYDVGTDASATVSIADNDGVNQAPTAVALLNTVPSIPETTSTASHVFLANISVTDDGQGTNNLSLSGADATSFEIVGSALYLKAGTALSHATKPTYSVTVNVDDPTVGATPDASTNFTLTVTQVVAPGSIIISEVAAWSSSSPLGADWFEVTNKGQTTVDLTGWKMDDNSHSIGNAVALSGVGSIAPNEAVIFIETASPATTAASFRSLWFGANSPAGLQIGSYSGSGVGLSSSGDEVVLFDGSGQIVTGVGFGASPSSPLATFDNHAGVGGTTIPLPLISTLSAVGTNNAFTASGDSNEIGSPGVGYAPNQAPTAVTLLNAVPSIPETTSTASHVFLANISVTDDGQGTNNLSLSGADATSFEIVGSALYLRAGTALSHATKPTYSVTINVDDPTVGGTPDASTNFTLTVTQVVAPGSIIISEVAAWSSSSPLGADWFEVTNKGQTTVDLTGWKMDDNSHSIGNAVALSGVSSIAPGEAVIFIETATPATTAAAFRSLWFGATPPAALQIGSYSGSGVGLSTSGDEVVLFDDGGHIVTGVGFGSSPSSPLATFDNHAGVGGTTIPLPLVSTLSTVGTNDAFRAASDSNEIGSPGVVYAGKPIVANNDTYSVPANTALTVSAALGVLANDLGSPLNVVTPVTMSPIATAHGSLTLNIDGSFSYTPNPGFTGTDSFTYSMTNAVQDFKTNLPSLATVGQGGVLTPSGVPITAGAFGSSLYPKPGSSNEFYGLTDRGPNVAPQAGATTSDGRTITNVLPLPDFTPEIGLFRMNANGVAQLEKIIPLTAADGTPYSGKVNSQNQTGELITDMNGNVLPADPNGYDSEGLVVMADGTFWVSDEYGPFITHFDQNGMQIGRLSPFDGSLPAELRNRLANRGMEGLTITPDGTTLVGMMQSALQQPDIGSTDPKKIDITRLITYNLITGEEHEYLYQLDNPVTNKTANSEITALDATHFIVDERDGNFPGVPGTPYYKKLWEINVTGATDVGPNSPLIGTTVHDGVVAYDSSSSHLGLTIGGKSLEKLLGTQNTAQTSATLAADGITPMTKGATPFLDLGALILTLDPSGKFFSHDKVEGVAVINGGTKLVISNDSDFGIVGVTGTTGPGNVDAPFNLVSKITTAGVQDDGEYIEIDLTKLPAATSSATVTFNVVADQTKTTITSNTPNPATVGQTVTFAGTVANQDAAATIPTGTVTILDNGAQVGSGPVAANGTFSIQVSGLAVGAHANLTAQYTSNSDNFAGSTSTAVTETVNAAVPTIVTTASPAITLGTTPPTLSDSAVLAGGYFETGNLLFTLTGPNGFTYTQTVPVNGNGTYTASDTLPTTGAVAGTYTWSVSYAGDPNNNSAVDQGGTAEQTVVSKSNPTITTTPSPNITLGTTAPTLSDSAVLANGYFETGNLVFTLTGPNGFMYTQTVPVSGNGTYTASDVLPTTGTVAGTYTWSVSYAGDANNNSATDNQAIGQLGDVFYIDMENHNLTQPSSVSSPQPLMGNAAAPYLNSLMIPGNPNAAQTSWASKYYNVLYNNPAVSIHPSEPNYIWQEAGRNGPLNDNDPYPNNIVNAPNLSALLQSAGISWKSYQEDTDLSPTSGSVNQPGSNALTSTVASQSQWTVPLKSFSGTSANYTNAYNGSHQYNYAVKHDGQPFFTATNGSTTTPNFSPSNPEAPFYAPLQQLQTDLNNNTVARYNLITPNQFNDMHSALTGGFTYQGVHYTGDQAAIAIGDNFLSQILPAIEASQAYKNNGAIVIWFDESEGGNSTQFTLPEIIISPLAKGNAYNSTQIYTHSSDLKTMQELFGVSAPGGGFLGDANTPGTNDLGDMFKPEQTIVSKANPTITTTASPAVAPVATGATLSDSAVLAGGYFETGNLVFTLTGPNGFTYTQTVAVNGNGTYSASDTLPTTGPASGTYTWHVSYAGDANNNGAVDQGGTAEQTVVPVTVVSLSSIATNPRNVSLASEDVTFSEPINLTNFDYGALTLTLNGGTNLIDGDVTISPVSGTAATYRIGGLAHLTAVDGTYVLTVDASKVQDQNGVAGTGTASVSWLMDTTPPTSKVSPLPATETSYSFTVSATGNDAPPASQPGIATSGVASYAIYVAIDNGPFGLWTTVPASNPSAVYTSQARHHYYFRSVATDAAGNVEQKPTVIEAATYVPDLTPPVTKVTSATINTSTDLFTLNLSGSDSGPSGLTTFKVFVQVDPGNPGSTVQQIATVAAGSPNAQGNYSGVATYQVPSSLLDGQPHTYRFYSTGVNGDGTVEAAHAAPNDVQSVQTLSPSPLAVSSLNVEKGLVERSYIRYIDIGFNQSGAALQSLIDHNDIRLIHHPLTGVISPSDPTVPLAGLLKVINDANNVPDIIEIDFGALGLGGVSPTGLNINQYWSALEAGDGYYELDFDLDNWGNFATHDFFYRLLGDVNGDRVVNTADVNAITAATGQSGPLLNADVNGDGTVNATDKQLAAKSLNIALKPGLHLDD